MATNSARAAPHTPAPPWPHPDTRAQHTIRAAWQDGYATAEREHYTHGWRAGLRLGCFLAGAACIPAGMAAGVALVRLGVMWGL